MKLLGAVLALMCSSIVTPLPAQGPVPKEVQDALSRATQKFGQAEAILDNLLRGRTIDRIERVGPDSLVDAGAADFQTAFTAALADMDAYVKSQKQRGSLEGMLRFEQAARQARDQLDRITEKEGTLVGRLSEGDITIAAPLLERMSPDERKQFREELTPNADAKYRKLAPRLWSATTPLKPLATQTVARCPFSATKDFGLTTRATAVLDRRSLADKVLDLLVPTAQASTLTNNFDRRTSLGIACYGVCHASLGLGCVVCILGAGAEAKNAWNSMVSCKSGCSKCHYYLGFIPSGGCWCRGACTAAFLAKLA